MSTGKAVRIEHDGAVLKITPAKVMQLFAESINRPAIELPALARSEIPRLGEYWPGQGGIRAAYMRGVDGNPDYSLIVPQDVSIYIDKIQWGSRGEYESGATSEWDGLKNTIALRASKHSHPAAEWTGDIEIDGHRDFYLAARRESAALYATVPELFKKKWHWTSTQYSPDGAFFQVFGGGYQDIVGKGGEFAVRPVRRVIHSVIY